MPPGLRGAKMLAPAIVKGTDAGPFWKELYYER